MNKRNITIYDIAKEANVSPATVSRVLTGNANVAEEKRKRIEEVIKKYDFQPNAVARSLFKKESKTIGVILPDIKNPFFSSVFMEVESAALKVGYIMMLCNTLNHYNNELLFLTTLSQRQVDAIILMGGSINECEPRQEVIKVMNQIMEKTPVVLINGELPKVDCHRIIVDEGKGIDDLVEYLISLGHSKIGILGGMKGVTSTDIKHEAFYRALKKNGLEINGNWVITESFDIESGYKCMNKLLENKNVPTAVITISDLIGVGAIKAAKSAGLRVPQDISITGFDGSYIANITDPPLTTVSQGYEEIGQVVMDTILDILNGKETEKLKIINSNIVIQASCSNIQ